MNILLNLTFNKIFIKICLNNKILRQLFSRKNKSKFKRLTFMLSKIYILEKLFLDRYKQWKQSQTVTACPNAFYFVRKKNINFVINPNSRNTRLRRDFPRPPGERRLRRHLWAPSTAVKKKKKKLGRHRRTTFGAAAYAAFGGGKKNFGCVRHPELF